jgi:hypothetical protein
MSGFENYPREALQIEHEIETKVVILGIDCDPDEPLDRARLELFGLAQLMLKVMKESAEQDFHTHGGRVWKTFARALWAEHDLRKP